MNDNVNRPSHYTFGSIEVIDYIRDKMTPEEFQGFCMGNVLKYVSRHKHKNGIEDLKKAQVYLGWLIESEEKNEPNDKTVLTDGENTYSENELERATYIKQAQDMISLMLDQMHAIRNDLKSQKEPG